MSALVVEQPLRTWPMSRPVDSILLLYHHPMRADAATIMEHVDAFVQHSRFPVWTVNVELGFPPGLRDLRFRVIVLHYSLFGSWPFLLSPSFLHYLAHEAGGSVKIAFFQDEYQFCQSRFAFVNQFAIDTIFTLLEPEHIPATYGKYTRAKTIITCLPGYVSASLIEHAREFAVPREKRSIDVGYRGRRLPFQMGEGAQEKHEIAVRFSEQAQNGPLRLDVASREGQRLYGAQWYRFLGNCRAVLGVEAGVTVFDVEDVIRKRMEGSSEANTLERFEDFSCRLGLSEWENRIPYRTISPRHFEAAAFRCCQVLYEGRYSGLLRPEIHYLPLRRDFANFAWVVAKLQDEPFCRVITENCYQDLIASERFHYASFIRSQFDSVLERAGINPGEISAQEHRRIDATLKQGHVIRTCYALALRGAHAFAPGKALLRACRRQVTAWSQHRPTKKLPPRENG